ncbi:hypothetical protein FSP39_013851 [Pinctada imbricata]|uniref:Reverse transcriptase domain-containing protein n=1 Tax=Pinctada imbricata TaxID=66713 RepID=A0AA88YD15_PINIB|nr:hypothetical protein FSP39_013851 [Pinctada imbricata]
MYTTLPHDKINDRLSKLIKWCFDREGKTYICTSESKGFVFATDYKSYKSWTCRYLCIALSFLLDNIYVRFGEKLYKQVVGIPMGTNCAPLVADLFSYTYEKEFIQNLQKQRKNDDVKCFIGTSRYLDDILTIDTPVFEKYKNLMYPQELILNKANVSNTETPFLDHNIKIVNGEIHTSVYDKRDDFGFNKLNFPWFDGDVPRLPSYGIYISQLNRYSMKIVFILFLCSFGVIRADFRQDVRNALSRLNGRSNYEFALEVYNLLAGNYPTKDWHVIAYNPILGSDKHQISYCQGIHYFRRSGRNVVVANVPSSKPYINLNSARQILRSLKTTRRYRVGGFLHLVDRTRNRGAEEIYDNFPSTLPGGCNTGIASRGVIKENADVQHKAKSERLISVVNGAYNMYVFG